jgi:hypothetical protein
MASSSVPVCLDLEVGAPQNQAILIHEGWLRDGLRRIEFHLKSTRYKTSSHERLLGTMVMRDTRTAIEQLEKCKAEEWARQYAVMKERKAPVIDTCEKIHLIVLRMLTLVFSHLCVFSNTYNGTPYMCFFPICIVSSSLGQCVSEKLQHRFIDDLSSLAAHTPRI